MTVDMDGEVVGKVRIDSARRQRLTCDRHSARGAVWRCRKCGAKLCEECPIVEQVAGAPMLVCPACGTPARMAAISDEEREPDLFATLFRQVPQFPFMGTGGYIFLGMVPVAICLYFTIDLLFADIAYSVISILLVSAYGATVVRSSSRGEAHPPDWPDFSQFYDAVVLPSGHLIFATLLTLGPALLSLYWTSNFQYLALALASVGLFFWPMAVLSICLHERVSALNPFFLFASIRTSFQGYRVAVVATSLAVLMEIQLIAALPELGFWLFLLAATTVLYLIMFQMRVIGLLYYSHRRQLGWFDE